MAILNSGSKNRQFKANPEEVKQRWLCMQQRCTTVDNKGRQVVTRYTQINNYITVHCIINPVTINYVVCTTVINPHKIHYFAAYILLCYKPSMTVHSFAHRAGEGQGHREPGAPHCMALLWFRGKAAIPQCSKQRPLQAGPVSEDGFRLPPDQHGHALSHSG